MENGEILRLSRGDSELELDCRGGSVLYYRSAGKDLLRPAVDGAHSSTGMAAFPLIPFAGRITDARFHFRGVDISLPPNFPPEPHAIHGHGWQGLWSVADRTDASATLKYTYSGDHWPWQYRAEQYFELRENALRLTMSVTNRGPGPMPAGLGWHPYFPRAGAVLQGNTSNIWHSDGPAIAGRPVEPTAGEDISRPRNVDELRLDHCFSLGSPSVRLDWPDQGISLELEYSEIFRHLVVYVPPGENFFCVEPISHAPDAVNSSLPAEVTGLRTLEEGGMLSGRISLKSRPAAD